MTVVTVLSFFFMKYHDIARGIDNATRTQLQMRQSSCPFVFSKVAFHAKQWMPPNASPVRARTETRTSVVSDINQEMRASEKMKFTRQLNKQKPTETAESVHDSINAPSEN